MNFVILRFDELGSTNTEALEQARRGADEGLCVVAKTQTAGRGRLGRAWQSPSGSGLYFSIVLRPKLAVKYLPLLTLMAAVTVHETLRSGFALAPDIKWVNDVLINGRKISGILAETAETDRGTAVVLGIGINLKSDNFPPGIADIATSIEAETGRPGAPPDPPDTAALLQTLTAKLDHFYEMLCCENGAENIKNEWAQRSSYYLGKDVRVILPNETLIGTTCGLEENGALRVKQPDGEIRIVQAGDVENLRAV
ncbi:MAG TPA: biotin--[acetyl-CoA-carboxylase] ligase [Pyrinomonadaceae bacterium]|jgi:BirA family biotin operon repressor/biotin-[acetyl-CoA-carboxylase] ligase|nr:biotin--[acetyl-CoA-carboxylase] ligase [Pyrinomonadaceae bacterium]